MFDYTQNNETLLKKAMQGDREAQDMLVTLNTGLVHSIVKRFSGRGFETEDLFQIGCIGLIKAIQRFDSSYGVKFSTYAVPMILGEIKRFIRDDGMIKVSRSLKETAIKAKAVKEQLTAQNGAEPTLKEIADKLSVTPAELAAAMEAGIHPESLYAVADDGSRENRPLIERLESNRDYESEIINKLVLRKLLSEFSERDQKIILMRYFKQKTQTQIAQMLGISQVQVSRIEKKVLLKMREKLTETDAGG
ncbi:SigB/SigF/SigG family RNA polymerase sigma factor [Ructibacterium gallinarum]|uniref:RNA polymerase sigma factor n=1 Tax=Ructibacterium gallinarum TaxID=2779355 RepID=A0A9D5M5M9_9FIRM|nr:SigB/SigF/SigG family RNA polymerase sigma factor [Ructibacterium gallinarum]MBE5041060.1 SigB/SigF/SigG family RNA polymerase sigma factor [Ructibacterium gallinarum]